MYNLTVETEFAAAHRIKEAEGKCERLHGHTWKVQVTLQGKKLDKRGILIDFREVKKLVKKSIDKLDHQYLNEVLKNMAPTTENIAKFLFKELEKKIDSQKIKLSEVKVGESDKTWISYSEEK
ncbi:6-carboxytetrahydropterin synthase QueD [Candidatus Aerophobetes bacterium]|nr:6-carboxytetrahydropterin synthase QueD [Candidatus Aerophobetes bacterium]